MVAPANPGDFDMMVSRHWTRTAIDSFDGSTLVISDLHLGDRSGADDFAPNEPFLQAFLEEVAPRARRVILNGDIFELWQTDLEPILFAYPRLIATLVELARQVEVIYILGNHDWLPFHAFAGVGLAGAQVLPEFGSAESGMLVLHGHQWDELTRTVGGGLPLLSAVSRMVTRLVGLCERIVPTIDDTLGEYGGRLAEFQHRHRNSPGRSGYSEGAADRYKEAAARLIREGGLRLVVAGHTHIPTLCDFDPGIYCNTGSWAFRRYPPTFAAVDDETVRLVDASTLRPLAKARLPANTKPEATKRRTAVALPLATAHEP